MIKNQKSIVSEVSSGLTISFYAKAFANIKVLSIKVQNPVLAAQIYYSTLLLPLSLDKTELLANIKPILEKAFQCKNMARNDGLFLGSEESTKFSLQLIQIIWQYHLDNRKIPEWLFSLAEKEACRRWIHCWWRR